MEFGHAGGRALVTAFASALRAWGLLESDAAGLQDRQADDEFKARGAYFRSLRPQLIDCQNLFCEVDGRGKAWCIRT